MGIDCVTEVEKSEIRRVALDIGGVQVEKGEADATGEDGMEGATDHRRLRNPSDVTTAAATGEEDTVEGAAD